MVAVVMVFGTSLSAGAQDADDKENPIVGAWELLSGWGTHVGVVFPDLTGVVKDTQREWLSELSGVECDGENVRLEFEFGGGEGGDIVLEGTIADDAITGEFSSGEKSATVNGYTYSIAKSNRDAKKSPLVGSWKLTSDWGGGEWEHYLVIFSDLTGSFKDMREGYMSEVTDVNATNDETSFTFLFGEGFETVFKGAIDGDSLKGTFSIEEKSAVVKGERE